jgi:riboflavin kinase/FMN adenylyltransferase
VYSIKARLSKGEELEGVCHLGPKPSFGLEPIFVEAHLFDFSSEIYGQELEIDFLYWIRPVRKFSTPEELKDQINQDCALSKQFLSGSS